MSATPAFKYDVFLSHNSQDKWSGDGTIRWMNVTRYLNDRKNKKSRQIIFDGEQLDMRAVWKLRDEFFPPGGKKSPYQGAVLARTNRCMFPVRASTALYL